MLHSNLNRKYSTGNFIVFFHI